MSGRNRSRAVLAGFVLLATSAAAGQGNDFYGNGLSHVDAQLNVGNHKLEQQRLRRGSLEQSLTAVGPQIEQLRTRINTNARALYRISRGGMLPVAGGMGALLGHASRVSRLERVVGRDLGELKRLEASTTGIRKELAQLDSALASAQRDLANLQTARADALRERATRRSFDAALGASSDAATAGERMQYGLSVIGGAQSERFSDQKGNLALPVSGPSSIHDATRAESDGPGLEFAAQSGAAVRAAASGRVAFAENYGSYGKLVILEHGDRYYTVYGGLHALEVQVGDTLSKSARVGSSGGDPVYFEVRRGTKTQDARLWLGL